MPRYLVKVRKAKWYKHSDVSWLPAGQLQADALEDLHTESNQLSVWQVEDNYSNLERVIAALAGTRDRITIFDYILFENQCFEHEIPIQKSDGNTPDDGANTSWHYELYQLTASKLLNLANCMRQSTPQRVQEPKVLDLLVGAVRSNRMMLERIRLVGEEKAKIRALIP